MSNDPDHEDPNTGMGCGYGMPTLVFYAGDHVDAENENSRIQPMNFAKNVELSSGGPYKKHHDHIRDLYMALTGKKIVRAKMRHDLNYQRSHVIDYLI